MDPPSPFTQRPWTSAVRGGADLGQVGAVEAEVDGDDGTRGQRRHDRRGRRLGALGDDQRLVDRQLPGGRVEDRRLDERPEVAEVGHGAAGRLRGHPVRAGQLVRRGQALRGQRVRRHDDVAGHVGCRRGGRGGRRRGGGRRGPGGRRADGRRGRRRRPSGRWGGGCRGRRSSRGRRGAWRGAVATGAAAVPLGVGATVAAVLADGTAAAAVPVAVAPAAVLVADGVAQVPATLAALLAPNTLPRFGISNAPPTPPTTATAPTIARSRVRDRGSNSRSWLKTLLLYDTTPFPFNRVLLPGDHSSPAVVSCPGESRFFRFARPIALARRGQNRLSAAQSQFDQAIEASCQGTVKGRNNFVRNGTQRVRGRRRPMDNAGIKNSGTPMPIRPPPGHCPPRGPPTPSSSTCSPTRTAPPPGSGPRQLAAASHRGTFHAEVRENRLIPGIARTVGGKSRRYHDRCDS